MGRLGGELVPHGSERLDILTTIGTSDLSRVNIDQVTTVASIKSQSWQKREETDVVAPGSIGGQRR